MLWPRGRGRGREGERKERRNSLGTFSPIRAHVRLQDIRGRGDVWAARNCLVYEVVTWAARAGQSRAGQDRVEQAGTRQDRDRAAHEGICMYPIFFYFFFTPDE